MGKSKNDRKNREFNNETYQKKQGGDIKQY